MNESELEAYHDGDIVPLSEAKVPIDDPGFQWGYNVYDLLITVEHEPYQLAEHVERTFKSCRASKMPLEMRPEELSGIVRDVVDRNVDLAGPDEDFMVFISVSGGWNVYEGCHEPPRVIVSARPLPFERMARDFIDGKHFVTTSVRQVPNESISPLVKHRSRMHFVLADIEAKQRDSNADPLLLDSDGNVTETAIGNIFVVTDGTLRTPPLTDALPGITRETTIRLAREELDIPVEETDLQLYDVYNADEVFWTNTSHVVAPITKVDGTEIGSGRPGPITERLLDAHSDRVDVDIVARFLKHLDPEERPETLQLGGDHGVQ
ncbi:aminotransferase class IV [Natrinema longum]|uniref:Aminotransferase class IV n=1 Tax=Natrinema longum TaxID=370324 RepID=A0A8A2UA94_9EURY|nr:aminotransferase class IV [Natrinema longum]MBZ6496515.1 aminotransferase class IV [Natrinema longum]QSW85580.1 aminotransferase class IV [Natrinema longum]